MGEIKLRQSDISQEVIMSEGDRAMLQIRHPQLPEARQLDATREEVVAALKKLSVKNAVHVELMLPGEEGSQTFVLESQAFDKLSPEKPMLEILKTAPVVKKLGHDALQSAGVEEKRNYSSQEWAGTPHKGKTTDQEKWLVRQHLDEINERLKGQGLRQIDLANKEHVERYELEALAKERGITPQ